MFRHLLSRETNARATPPFSVLLQPFTTQPQQLNRLKWDSEQENVFLAAVQTARSLFPYNP